jgi:mono/diheme cytochrome c family protein
MDKLTGLRAGACLVATAAAILLAPRITNLLLYTGSRGVAIASQAPEATGRNRIFERTPARLKRGEYLVENVVTCFRCHSERDWKSPGAPPVSGKKGAGFYFVVGAGPVDPNKLPPVYAANITPDPETGIGKWSDEEVARAIRDSIDRDGRAFPGKFHVSGNNLSGEDLASVVVYLRTVPAVRRPAPANANAQLKTEAATTVPARSQTEPPQSDPVRRGEYLVSIADCASCHTADAPNAPLLGKKFAGGKMMSDNPEHYVVTPNITMDPSGISYYDEAQFVAVLRTGNVTARKLYPIMPWGYFQNMTDEDLKAIFAYLKTVPRLQHNVDNTELPTPCRRCLQRHGAGDRN